VAVCTAIPSASACGRAVQQKLVGCSSALYLFACGLLHACLRAGGPKTFPAPVRLSSSLAAALSAPACRSCAPAASYNFAAVLPQACLTCTGVVIFTGVGKSGLISQVGLGGSQRQQLLLCAAAGAVFGVWQSAPAATAAAAAAATAAAAELPRRPVIAAMWNGVCSQCWHLKQRLEHGLLLPVLMCAVLQTPCCSCTCHRAAEDLPDASVHRHQSGVPEPAGRAGEGSCVWKYC